MGFRTLGFNCCRNMRNRLQPVSVAANRLFVVIGLVWRGVEEKWVMPVTNNPSNSFGVRARQLTDLRTVLAYV